MEGIAFQIKWMMEYFNSKPSEKGIILSGGATKSRVWTQIVADIIGLPVRIPSYTRFHQYIAPAMDAYDRAKASGNPPTEKEYARTKRSYDSLKYKLEKTSGTEEQYEAAYAMIEGLDAVPDFGFHDSKPILFEQTSDRAILKLQFHEITLTLEFLEIADFTAEGDPITNWINDFYCYPAFHNPELICFDIGYYRIDCKTVRVIDVKYDDASR